MKIFRYDQGEIQKTFKTDDGFLRADSIVTKTGVFKYANPDGTIRRELRHPDEVFKNESMDSMKLIPITKLHPKERIVTSDNAKNLKVGSTGESVRKDGEFLRNTLVVTDQDAIDGIESKEIQELSLGYTLDLIPESGTFNGDDYDFRQTNIDYNHLALVPVARAGREARIALDANDAVMVIDENKSYSNPKKEKTTMTLVKVNADNGLPYDAAPEVAQFLQKETKRADMEEDKVKTLTSEKEKLEANFDEAKVKLKKLETIDHSDEIKKAVKARLILEKAAIERLDEKQCENLDSMSDKEIQIAIIKKQDPDFNADDRSDEYMNARFDAAMLSKPKEMKSTDKQKPQINKDAKNNNSNSDRTPEQARQDMIDRDKNAWKKEEQPA